MDTVTKQEMSEFFTRFWDYEPQPSFPEFVEFFKEQGIDIRKRPYSERWNNRDVIRCDACGHAVGRVTPNMGKFGGGEFVSFEEERRKAGQQAVFGQLCSHQCKSIVSAVIPN